MERGGSIDDDLGDRVVAKTKCKEEEKQVYARRLHHVTPTSAHSGMSDQTDDGLEWTMEDYFPDEETVSYNSHRFGQDKFARYNKSEQGA